MKNSVIGATMSVFALTGAASASTVNVSYQPDGVFGSANLGKTVTIETNGGIDGEVKAGLFHLTGDNGMGDFLAFCVDLAQYLKDPTEYTIDANLFDSTVVNNIDQLFSSVLGGADLASVIDTKVEAAGLQVALWEVVYDADTGFDLSSGDFSMSKNLWVKSKAQSYLDGFSSGVTGQYDLTFLSSADYQDVVTISPVPLPASGALFGFGLAGLMAARRRRARG